ncbi:MAG: DUF5131 family protein [Spirochaetales bacterium]
MAKNSPGDILTGDWNPIIGCERASLGCRNCWYLDGIFQWQQRLGNIPPEVKLNEPYVFQKRLSPEALKAKNGVIGIVQHGDLFWDKVSTDVVHRVLDIIDEVALAKRITPKYVLWTKRAERASLILNARYPHGMPDYLALSVSVEDQANANGRLPHLLKAPTKHKIVMIEPMYGPIDLTGFHGVEWIVIGSETGAEDAIPINLDWVRKVRDFAVEHDIKFFIKQLGSSHRVQERVLDGRTWDEVPRGFVK